MSAGGKVRLAKGIAHLQKPVKGGLQEGDLIHISTDDALPATTRTDEAPVHDEKVLRANLLLGAVYVVQELLDNPIGHSLRDGRILHSQRRG